MGEENNPCNGGVVDEMISMQCSASTHALFTYTFLNEDNVCVMGDYKIYRDKVLYAKICLNMPPSDDDNKYDYNFYNVPEDDDNNNNKNDGCFVCMYYNCNLKDMMEYYDDTNLEPYCGQDYEMYLDGGKACYGKYLNRETFFNNTMPIVARSSSNRTLYELMIRNETCEVRPLPISIDLLQLLPIVVLVSGVGFLLAYCFYGNKIHRSLASSSTTTDSNFITPKAPLL